MQGRGFGTLVKAYLLYKMSSIQVQNTPFIYCTPKPRK